MIRLIRAPFAAVLAFMDAWQPPIAPRRIMADAVVALNEFEAENETLPEPSSARFGSTWCATHHTTISTCYQEHQCDELPVSEAVTTSAGECVWSFTSAECRRGGTCICRPQLSPVPLLCYGGDSCICDSPQSSPNPHGDLPSVPMPADGSAAEVSAAPPAPSAAPSTFTDWATPAILDVLAECHPDESKAGAVWCFDEPGSTGRLNSHGQYADWQEWREHVAPLIAQRLQVAGAQHAPK